MKIIFVIVTGTLLLSLYLLEGYSVSLEQANDNKSNGKKYNNQTYNSSKAKKLYYNECSKCHRKNGKGVKRVYPPLKDADYIKNNTTENLLRGILYGRSGTIEVNGWEYNGVMTTEVDKSLKDEEIAMILTYLYKELNGIEKIVSSRDVEKARELGPLNKN